LGIEQFLGNKAFIKNMGYVSLFFVGTEHIQMGITAFYQASV
jgi:hypothetical protein